MKIEIKFWLTESVLFEGDFPCIADAVKAAVANKANLSGADLSRADLSRAYLSGAAHAWAQVAFMGHGECGRMLTALVIKEGDEPKLFCGCFTGSFADLDKYIADGDPKYRKTRTLAMNTVKALLAARNEEDEP